jgi:hypothetical protein
MTRNPFVTMIDPKHGPLQACSAEDRCAMARSFNRRQCLDALELEGLQKIVIYALRKRLRALDIQDGLRP